MLCTDFHRPSFTPWTPSPNCFFPRLSCSPRSFTTARIYGQSFRARSLSKYDTPLLHIPPCVSTRKFARKLFFSSCPVCPITNEEASFISSTETCLEGIARKGDRIFRFTLLEVLKSEIRCCAGGILIFEWDRLEIFGLYDTFQVSSACSSMYSRLVTRRGEENFPRILFFCVLYVFTLLEN